MHKYPFQTNTVLQKRINNTLWHWFSAIDKKKGLTDPFAEVWVGMKDRERPFLTPTRKGVM